MVLPILHLNGYKIANPTVLDRIPQEELRSLMVGYGHNPYLFEAAEDEDHFTAHRRFAALLDEVLNEIAGIKALRRDLMLEVDPARADARLVFEDLLGRGEAFPRRRVFSGQSR